MGGTVRTLYVAALALLVGVVYAPSSRVLATEWNDFANLTYTHGWLVLAVCLGLAWRERGRLAAAAVAPSRAGLIALAACSFAWLVAWRASIQDLHVTLLPALFWFATLAAFGWPVARALLFPCLFLYFAVPSWSQLAGPLQSLTVLAMRAVLFLTGPQALIEGDRIRIPTGTFIVEEGCSGLHFMIVGLAVAALHGELERDRIRARLLQLGLVAALALLANWVRVYVIILAGYFTDMRSGLLANHYWFGWGVFAVALFVFFRLVRRIPALSAPGEETQPLPGGPQGTSALAGWLLSAAVLTGVPLASAALRATSAGAAPPPPAPPEVAAPWTRTLVEVSSPWQPRFLAPSWQQRLEYARADGAPLEVYRVGYGTQTQDSKLVSGRNSLVGDELAATSPRRIVTGFGAFREMEVARWKPPHERSIIWYRYRTAGREFAAPLPAQLWYGLNATVAHPTASLTAYRAACQPDCAAARQEIAAFLAAAGP